MFQFEGLAGIRPPPGKGSAVFSAQGYHIFSGCWGSVEIVSLQTCSAYAEPPTGYRWITSPCSAFSAIATKIIYGIDIERLDDERHLAMGRVIAAGEAVGTPGRFLVDVFPILRYVPSWFPGGQFHTFAASTNRKFVEVIASLYAEAIVKMVCSLPCRHGIYTLTSDGLE